MAHRHAKAFDLALTETIDARINAVRDVMRAEWELREAKAANAPSRISVAARRLESAAGHAVIALRTLETAIAAEAKERA